MIKLNLKFLPYAVIAVLIMALLYTNDKAKRVATQLETSQAEAVYWKDKEGKANAEIEVLRVENFKQTKLADSLKKLDIKPKTVQKVVTIRTHSTDTVTIINGRPFGNKWANFQIDDDLLKYSFTDSIALVTYTDRYGFLNLNSKYVTRAISYNPHTILTGITSTEILPKTRRVSFGLYSGYGLQLGRDGIVRHGWSAGVGLSFRIF